MSNTSGDDILNVDFDPDVLIDLIGKLSLDAVPLDVSETLLSLENRMEAVQNPVFPVADHNNSYPFSASLTEFVSPPCDQIETRATEPSTSIDVEKERFLLSIGLGPRTAVKPPVKRTSGKELSYILNRLEPPDSEYNTVLDDPPSSPYGPVFVEDDVLCLPNDEFDEVVKGFLNVLCDKNTPYGGELTFPPVNQSDFQPIAVSDLQSAALPGFQPAAMSNFQSAAASGFQSTAVSDFQSMTVTNFQPAVLSDFQTTVVSDFLPNVVPDFQPSNHTLDPPFHEILQQQIGSGNVIDIDLNTLDCRPKFDQTTSLLNEISSDSDGSYPSLGSYSQEGLCSENSQTSSVDKFVCSPDSGYTSCSSVISPCSLNEQSETQCLYDISEEDDQRINELVAALIEVENNFNFNLTGTHVQNVSSNVPVLARSGDSEDYKERILNFLKEPLSAEQPLSPQSDGAGDSGSSSEPLSSDKTQENGAFFCFSPSKSSPMKGLKQGFEFRYASKSELRHSSLLSKLKLHTEKSKILKQIQEDEREQKRLKMLQVLDRKLKRGRHFLSPEKSDKIPELENSLWQIQFSRSIEKAASLLLGASRVSRNQKFSSEASCLLRSPPVDDIENKRRKVQCKDS